MFFNLTIGIQGTDKEKTKVNFREAVRAVVFKDGKLLMVKSNKGDYKLPGGGAKSGETHEAALIREVREETGFTVVRVIEQIGVVTQRSIDEVEKGAIFEMVSCYYLCEVSDAQAPLALDDYEAELDFCPQWAHIDAAISSNEAMMHHGAAAVNNWTSRETTVLRELKRLLV